MDEAHEMKINKGTKQLAGRPTEETCIDHFPWCITSLNTGLIDGK